MVFAGGYIKKSLALQVNGAVCFTKIGIVY
jgi:hypothetical protein